MSLPDISFARRFRNACREAGLPGTQKELGKAIGVSGPMVFYYQHGEKKPSIDKAVAICDKLGVCVEWLLTGKGPKHPADLEHDAREWLDITDLPSASRDAIQALLDSLKSAN
jgi:transcriptional regulator with XRE-family HTH domain